MFETWTLAVLAEMNNSADAGLAANEHRGRLAVPGAFEGGLERGQFCHPADEYRGARAHALHDVSHR